MISFLWLAVPLRRVIRFVKSSPWKRTMPDDLLLLLHRALVLSLLPLPTCLQSWHRTGLESWWFLWICHYFLSWRVFVCMYRIALSLGYPEIGDARKLSKTLMQFSHWSGLYHNSCQWRTILSVSNEKPDNYRLPRSEPETTCQLKVQSGHIHRTIISTRMQMTPKCTHNRSPRDSLQADGSSTKFSSWKKNKFSCD